MPWWRLVTAVIVAALLWVVFNILTAGLPSENEHYNSLLMGFGLLLLIYGVVIPMLCSMAFVTQRVALQYSIYSVSFVVFHFVFCWLSYTQNDYLYQGGKVLVIDREITPDGWMAIAYYLSGAATIAMATAFILFRRQ